MTALFHKMKSFVFGFVGILVLLSDSSGLATTRYVDVNGTNAVQPFISPSTAATNIKAAMDVSSSTTNDTVIVAPGTYNELVDFEGKPIYLVSAGGPSKTFIVPPGGSTAVNFGRGERSNSILAGFTLKGGDVYVSFCSPTLISNSIVNAPFGVYGYNASPNVISNFIAYNTNGGIYLGAAGNAFIKGNVIVSNLSGGIGLGAAGWPTIIDNFIQGNKAGGIGMGNECDANIIQNIIVQNSGDGIGGLVPGETRGPWLINNTVYGNGGTGISLVGFLSSSELLNNIVVGNPAIILAPWYGGPPPDTQFNDFYSAEGNVYGAGNVTNFTSIQGNISTDPMFTFVSAFDFHLLSNSPCIDAGTNGPFNLASVDFDGYQRIIAGKTSNGFVEDMGAFEFHLPNFISILNEPSNQIAFADQVAAFSVTAISQYPLSYQWRFNGTNLFDGGNIAGSTNPVLILYGVRSNYDGAYQVVVTNQYYSVTSSVATLLVLQAPDIFLQPTNTAASIFGAGTFSVGVTGVPPFSFQWQKDDTNLFDGIGVNGSTNSTLTILSAQFIDNGEYSVRITNSFGSILSAAATLTVVPAFTWGYAAQTPSADTTNAISVIGGPNGADFGVALRADGRVVQWQLNGEVPDSATNIVAISAGMYYVLGLRQDGTVLEWGDTNLNSLARTNPPPEATNIVAIAAGYNHCLALRNDGTVLAWGDNSYGQASPPNAATNVIRIAAGSADSFALRRDGSIIGWGRNAYGQDTAPLSITNAVDIASGEGHVLALQSDGTVGAWGKNYFGESTPPSDATNIIMISGGSSGSIALRADGTMTGWGNVPYLPAITNIFTADYVGFGGAAIAQNPYANTPASIWQEPEDRTIPTGQTTIYHPYGKSLPAQSYQWFFNNKPIVDQTNRWLVIPAIQMDQAGDYYFTVSNLFGSATSRVAVISEDYHALIANNPSSQATLLGSDVTFTVGMYGLPPFYYQWYFNGELLTNSSRLNGATSSALTISNVVVEDAGNYSVVVTNGYNSATSTLASLTVLVPASIVSQPSDQGILVNSNAVFSVAATGTTPLNYQWVKDGTNLIDGGIISGATTANLTISGAQTQDDGQYQVIVSNAYGMSTSLVAVLTVYDTAVIQQQPSSAAVLIGGNANFAVVGAGTSLGYQWYFNGLPIFDNNRITGSSTSTLTISNVLSSDSGGYWIVVSNLVSSVTSMTASLTPLLVATSSVRFVSLNGTNPIAPYLTWETAASNIQDAIDASVDGDTILAGDGLYQTGGRVVYGALSNRVVLNKAVAVQSLNGTARSFIQGFEGAGSSSVRCAYLTNRASLVGFALTKGGTLVSGDLLKEQSGGGAWCESTNAMLVNCLIESNTAAQFGGGVVSGTCSNCTIAFNFATSGGGAFNGVLNGSTLVTNAALNGAGACSNILNNCTLMGNAAKGLGGGVYGSALNQCKVSWNTNSGIGGGMDACLVANCFISNNVSMRDLGGGASRSALIDCLLVNNQANGGGGVYASDLTNCTLKGNLALDSVGGGGALQSTLYNCTLTSNSATTGEGGCGYGCAFNDCLISSNWAPSVSGSFGSSLINCTVVGHTNGFAAFLCTVRNSIVYYNSTNYYGGSLLSCCTEPLPSGFGNFTNDPRFLNLAIGDFRLQSNSPCINAGNNLFVTNSTDLDGNPRIRGGTVDIGGYEFQSPASIISYQWLQYFGLPLDSSVALADADADGMNNWQEWIAGTNPTNNDSVLRLAVPNKYPWGLEISWQSVGGKMYFIQRGTNLAEAAFTSIRSNIVGQAGSTFYTDTSARGSAPYFYRVGVQ